MLYSGKVLRFDFVDTESSSWTIQMKAIEQYFPDQDVYNISASS